MAIKLDLGTQLKIGAAVCSGALVTTIIAALVAWRYRCKITKHAHRRKHCSVNSGYSAQDHYNDALPLQRQTSQYCRTGQATSSFNNNNNYSTSNEDLFNPAESVPRSNLSLFPEYSIKDPTPFPDYDTAGNLSRRINETVHPDYNTGSYLSKDINETIEPDNNAGGYLGRHPNETIDPDYDTADNLSHRLNASIDRDYSVDGDLSRHLNKTLDPDYSAGHYLGHHPNETVDPDYSAGDYLGRHPYETIDPDYDTAGDLSRHLYETVDPDYSAAGNLSDNPDYSFDYELDTDVNAPQGHQQVDAYRLR